jgi:uncharacterized membrane protein YtjA (UPF0391 family)
VATWLLAVDSTGLDCGDCSGGVAVVLFVLAALLFVVVLFVGPLVALVRATRRLRKRRDAKL